MKNKKANFILFLIQIISLSFCLIPHNNNLSSISDTDRHIRA